MIKNAKGARRVRFHIDLIRRNVGVRIVNHRSLKIIEQNVANSDYKTEDQRFFQKDPGFYHIALSNDAQMFYALPFPFAAPGMHDSLAGDDVVPDSQAKHEAAPPGVYVPMGHGRQSPPKRETVPAGHGTHKANIPWNPAGHTGNAGASGRPGSGSAGRSGSATGSGGSGIGNCACMT